MSYLKVLETFKMDKVKYFEKKRMIERSSFGQPYIRSTTCSCWKHWPCCGTVYRIGVLR